MAQALKEELIREGAQALRLLGHTAEHLRDALAVAQAMDGDQIVLPDHLLDPLELDISHLQTQLRVLHSGLRGHPRRTPSSTVKMDPDTPAPPGGDLRPEEASGISVEEALERARTGAPDLHPAEEVRPGSHELDLYRLPWVRAAEDLLRELGLQGLQEDLRRRGLELTADNLARWAFPDPKAGGEDVKRIMMDPDAEVAPYRPELLEEDYTPAGDLLKLIPWGASVSITLGNEHRQDLGDALKRLGRAADALGAPAVVSMVLRGLGALIAWDLDEDGAGAGEALLREELPPLLEALEAQLPEELRGKAYAVRDLMSNVLDLWEVSK